MDKEIVNIPIEFDKCIWCGMPVFWSMKKIENCTKFWWKDLMLGWPSKIKNNFMILGAGSCFTWGNEVSSVYNKERLIKSAKDVLERSYYVTARDKIVSKVTEKLVPTMICPAIFSVIDDKISHELKFANLMPYGGHYPSFNTYEAEIWEEKKHDISEILKKNNFIFVAHSREEYIFAKKLKWKQIIYTKNSYDLLVKYGKCGKYFGNRVHGAIIARGNNADVWSVGYDSRQEAVRLSGAKVSKPSELILSEIANWASSNNEIEEYDLEFNFKKQVEIVKRFMVA